MPRKTKETNDIEKDSKKTSSKKLVTQDTNTKKATAKTASAKKSTTKTTTAKKSTTTAKTKSASTSGKQLDSKSKSKKQTTSKSKKATSSAKSKNEIVEYYDLPYRYNQTIVKVLAQTPKNLFIYWDISDTDRENYKKQYGDDFFETTIPVLIVHNLTFNYSFEVKINDFANSWYLNVNDAKSNYKIELGRRPIIKTEKLNTDYIYLTSSNEIESPNDKILFNKEQQVVHFRNIKTGEQQSKNIANLSFINNLGKIYNLYEKMYKDEKFNDKNIDITSFTSSNSSPTAFSSQFK